MNETSLSTQMKNANVTCEGRLPKRAFVPEEKDPILVRATAVDLWYAKFKILHLIKLNMFWLA